MISALMISEIVADAARRIRGNGSVIRRASVAAQRPLPTREFRANRSRSNLARYLAVISSIDRGIPL